MAKQISLSDEDAEIIAKCLRDAAKDHKAFMSSASHFSGAEAVKIQAEWLAHLDRLAGLFSFLV
jgi:hypothetical protein